MPMSVEEQLFLFVSGVQAQTRPASEFLPKDGLVLPATRETAVVRLRTNATRFKFNYATLTCGFSCLGLVFDSKTALVVLCATVFCGYVMHNMHDSQH